MNTVVTQVAPARRRRALAPPTSLLAVIALIAIGLLGALVALSTRTSGDYALRGAVGGDNAAPGLDALLHGSFGSFASRQPLMGLTSLLLRLPVAAVAASFGSSQLSVYRLGALACLLVPALFCGWLVLDRRGSLGGVLSAVLVSCVVVLGPTTVNAIGSGHPEEPLAAVLTTAAVLSASRGSAGWAGLLLGLAIGTKEWTLLGLLPVLMALPRGRRRAVLAALAVAAALTLPQILADPAAFARAGKSLGAGHLVNALSAWWPLGHRTLSLPAGAPLVAVLPSELSKSAALGLALVLATCACGLGWLRLGGENREPDAMAVLTLLALVRCLGDPGPVEYYYVAVLVPLATWEVAVIRRVPLVTLLALGATTLAFGPGATLPAGTLSACMFAWSIPLAGYLVVHGFALKRTGSRPIRVTCEG